MNQMNLYQWRNQQNHLINAQPLRQAQAQAADPALVQILAGMQQLISRPLHQPNTADKCVMLPQQHFDGS